MPIYARFPQEKGRVTRSSHKGWTELDAVDQGVHCPVSMQVGSDCCQDYGRLDFDTLVIRCKLDGSIVPLHNHLYNRKPFAKEFQIDFCHLANNKAQTYLSLFLDTVWVSDYRFRAKKNTQSILLELAFSHIHTRYFPHDKQGQAKSPSSMAYDLAAAT